MACALQSKRSGLAAWDQCMSPQTVAPGWHRKSIVVSTAEESSRKGIAQARPRKLVHPNLTIGKDIFLDVATAARIRVVRP